MGIRIYGRLLVLSMALVLSTGSMGRGESAIGDKVPVVPVALSTLISNPQASKMTGAEVSVFGFLFGPSLYLTRDHAQAKDFVSSIWVLDHTEEADFYTSDCDKKYVKIYGRLTTGEHGELQIGNVSKVLIGDTKKTCYIEGEVD